MDIVFDVFNEQLDREFAQVGAIIGPYLGSMYEVVNIMHLGKSSIHSNLHCRKVAEA